MTAGIEREDGVVTHALDEQPVEPDAFGGRAPGPSGERGRILLRRRRAAPGPAFQVFLCRSLIVTGGPT
jgi:hypothetical protein